jgi:predicted transcriptional regulator
MAEHPEKRMTTVSFKTTESVAKALDGLAHADDFERSYFIHLALTDLVEKQTVKARILINALGIKTV